MLIEKARKIHGPLDLGKRSDYEVVEKAILKAYELVPEAYRQKLRNCIKEDDQIYFEFASKKELLFKKWLTSKEVTKHFDKLKQWILIEEFKQCIHSDIRNYLDQHKVFSLAEASTMADDL